MSINLILPINHVNQQNHGPELTMISQRIDQQPILISFFSCEGKANKNGEANNWNSYASLFHTADTVAANDHQKVNHHSKISDYFRG